MTNIWCNFYSRTKHLHSHLHTWSTRRGYLCQLGLPGSLPNALRWGDISGFSDGAAITNGRNCRELFIMLYNRCVANLFLCVCDYVVQLGSTNYYIYFFNRQVKLTVHIKHTSKLRLAYFLKFKINEYWLKNELHSNPAIVISEKVFPSVKFL